MHTHTHIQYAYLNVNSRIGNVRWVESGRVGGALSRSKRALIYRKGLHNARQASAQRGLLVSQTNYAKSTD